MGRKNVGFIILFLLIGFIQFSKAQPRLVLVKGDKTIVSFHEGDPIRFKRKDRDHFTTGLIGGLTRDYLRIGEDTTFLFQIEKVDLTGRENSGFKTSTIGTTFIVAGMVLFLGDLINETVVHDEDYSADGGVMAVSAALVGTGVLMQFLNNDYFKFGRRKKMVVLDY